MKPLLLLLVVALIGCGGNKTKGDVLKTGSGTTMEWVTIDTIPIKKTTYSLSGSVHYYPIFTNAGYIELLADSVVIVGDTMKLIYEYLKGNKEYMNRNGREIDSLRERTDSLEMELLNIKANKATYKYAIAFSYGTMESGIGIIGETKHSFKFINGRFVYDTATSK